MFIDTMSSAELMREYSNDLPEIRQRTHALSDSDYVTNYLHKRTKQEKVVVTKQIKTKNGNTYLGTLIFLRRGSGKGLYWEWLSIHVGLMNTSRGLMVLTFFEDERTAVKYTPHFFNRYKERMLNDDIDWKTRNQLQSTKTLEQIISLYIQRNLGTSWIKTQSVYKDKSHIFAPVPDGVTLIQFDSRQKVMQANTFVTYSMLDEKQLNLIENLRRYHALSETEQKQAENPLFLINNQ